MASFTIFLSAPIEAFCLRFVRPGRRILRAFGTRNIRQARMRSRGKRRGRDAWGGFRVSRLRAHGNRMRVERSFSSPSREPLVPHGNAVARWFARLVPTFRADADRGAGMSPSSGSNPSVGVALRANHPRKKGASKTRDAPRSWSLQVLRSIAVDGNAACVAEFGTWRANRLAAVGTDAPHHRLTDSVSNNQQQ
jgi:hypothetical protein